MAKVSIAKCEEYSVDLLKSSIERAVDLIGGFTSYVKPGDRVLLKPNLIAGRKPSDAATTHPDVLRALTRILREHGCKVAIGDSTGGAIAGISPTARALEASGYSQVCNEEGADLTNFDRLGAIAVPSRTGRFVKEFHIARPVIEADVVINVPKMKVHSFTGITGAIKNTFGCIPGLRKAEYHRIAPVVADFAELIADIHLASRVTLSVMDAVTGMEGTGPTNGTPIHVGYVLASADSLALDTVMAQMIGFDAEKLDLLKAAARLGVGEPDPAKIDLLGDAEAPPNIGFKLPATAMGARRMPRWMVPLVINLLKSQPEINRVKCRKCGMCRDSCPVKAIDDNIVIDRSKCITCMCCHELCPYGAVDLQRVNPVTRVLLPAGKSLGGH